MSVKIQSLFSRQILIISGIIWLGSNLCDRLWLKWDRSVPGWDQSNHLTNALSYLHALQSPQWWDGDWWHGFWSISTKYPPVTYLVAAPFQAIFGQGNEGALMDNWFYSAILLLSVYLLGAILLSAQVGLWAAAITVLIPRIYQTRLNFLLDTPLLAITLASFCALTIWRDRLRRGEQWLWAIAFGLALGVGLLTKQSIVFFLFFPLLSLILYYLWQRQWQRILQLLASFLVSALVWFPWYRTNWIYLFSTLQNSNTIPATLEGDPPLNTLAAWTYYWRDLPAAVSWVWLIVPLVGILLHGLGQFPKDREGIDGKTAWRGIGWLAIYFSGSYLVCSSIFNKDTRYILPYLPVLAIFLAYGLTLWRGRWGWVRWAALALAIAVALGNLFPIPFSDRPAMALSPNVLSRPLSESPAPNADLIETAIQLQPYQIHTLGVIANTNSINHNTLNYFGTLRDRQVYGRELGTTPRSVAQDGRTLDWFVTKTGDNGFANGVQLELAGQLAANPDFVLIRSWTLPDRSEMQLFHRKHPQVSVEFLTAAPPKVTLDRLEVPSRVPPGQPVPVRYEWTGRGQDLAEGIVLLTWRSLARPTDFWLHDRGIGMGQLFIRDGGAGFRVVENTAMLPPANLPAGQYRLEARYLNRKTGETYEIALPEAAISLDPARAPLSAPELDLVTQLRNLSLNLPLGVRGLEPIFQQVDRLNQYDPTQDYLAQAEIALNYRLQHDSHPSQSWHYGVILANVLQEDAPAAIAALQDLIQRDPSNPYFHAYLAFVYLYNWQPRRAQAALNPALLLAPDVPEIQGLQAAALFMQGRFIRAWQIARPLLHSPSLAPT